MRKPWSLPSLWQQLLGKSILSIDAPYCFNLKCCHRFLALIAAFADISQLRGLHVQERRQGNIIVMDTSTDSYSDEISTEAAAAGLDGV